MADASLWDAGNARFQEDDAPVRCESNEDDGDINAANAVDFGSDGLSACRGTIGDGPNADPSGDFDFYNLGAFESGEFGEIVLATNFADQTLQGAVQILDTSGNQVPILDAFELREGVVSFIFAAPVAATYVARIQDAESFQNDPFDSGSGSGAAGTGDYVAVMLRQRETNVDTDVFLVDLEVGDVMRVAMIGAGMTDLLGPDGRLVQGSFSSPSFIYPQNSPLKHLAPVGSDLIVEGAGRHGIAVSFGGGPYELEVQVIRSGLTYSEGTDQQILWLDFDGATINPTIWVPGLPDDDVTLSPLADFLTDFGLDAGDEDAVIDGIIAVMEEDFNGDLGSTGGNGDRDVTNNAGEFDVEILNSRDHGDLWGQPNVTRIIVGGTIDELGIPTIGIAQSIDPGNFDTEESTVVLLDVLSSDPESPFGGASLNQFEVAEGASRLDLVARGIGSISSHEAGHVLGNWHTTTENDVFNIMDEGGNIAPIAGVGADGVWGTPDDLDLDHVTDQYSFFEGFTGFENTASRTAHGLSTGRTAPDDGGGDGLEPGVYIIENAQRGRNLHADGTSNADTSTLQDNTSRWELIDIGERWLLRNLSNGQYLDADEAGENFNVEFSANPAADDEWAITETEGGNYILQNRVTGRYLDSDGGPDFNVDQSVNPSFDDEWIFRPVDGDDGGGDGDFGAGDVVLVQSVDNNRYLEAEGADEGFNADTTTILSNSTTWQLEDSGGGSFFLRNLGTGRYLDTDADGEVDTSVNASNDDRWEFIDIGDGVLNVRSVERNQFLDSDGATNNFNVDLSVNPALDDRWRLIAAPQ